DASTPTRGGYGGRPPARAQLGKSTQAAVGRRQSQAPDERQTRTAPSRGSQTGATRSDASTPTRGGYGGSPPPPERSSGESSLRFFADVVFDAAQHLEELFPVELE